MKKVARNREQFDAEAAAISDISGIIGGLHDWKAGVRVLLYVLSSYWPNGWHAAIRAHGSGLQD